MTTIRLSIIFISALCVALSVAGCSVVGFTLGAVTDATTADYDTLSVSQATELSEGDSVCITSCSDASIAGRCVGLDRRRTERYAQYYRAWWRNDSCALEFPSLDESVVLVHNSPLRANVEGTLLGFDPGVICVQGEMDTEMVGVGDLAKLIAGHGNILRGPMLRKWLGLGRVPFMSTLCVTSGLDTVRIPLYDVREIRKANTRQQKWKSLATGAVFDAVIMGLTYLAFSDRHLWGR